MRRDGVEEGGKEGEGGGGRSKEEGKNEEVKGGEGRGDKNIYNTNIPLCPNNVTSQRKGT